VSTHRDWEPRWQVAALVIAVVLLTAFWSVVAVLIYRAAQ
jgi:hypothetical protein